MADNPVSGVSYPRGVNYGMELGIGYTGPSEIGPDGPGLDMYGTIDDGCHGWVECEREFIALTTDYDGAGNAGVARSKVDMTWMVAPYVEYIFKNGGVIGAELLYMGARGTRPDGVNPFGPENGDLTALGGGVKAGYTHGRVKVTAGLDLASFMFDGTWWLGAKGMVEDASYVHLIPALEFGVLIVQEGPFNLALNWRSQVAIPVEKGDIYGMPQKIGLTGWQNFLNVDLRF